MSTNECLSAPQSTHRDTSTVIVCSTVSTDRWGGGEIQRDREEELRLVGEFARTRLVFHALGCQVALTFVVKRINRIVVIRMRGGSEILYVAGGLGQGRRLAIFGRKPREFLPDGFSWKWAATVVISDTEARLRRIACEGKNTKTWGIGIYLPCAAC